MKRIFLLATFALCLLGCSKSSNKPGTGETFLKLKLDGVEYRFAGKMWHDGTEKGAGIADLGMVTQDLRLFSFKGYDGTQYVDFSAETNSTTLGLQSYQWGNESAFLSWRLNEIGTIQGSYVLTIQKIENGLYSGIITGTLSVSPSQGGSLKKVTITDGEFKNLELGN